jgi:hypothetical protein
VCGSHTRGITEIAQQVLLSVEQLDAQSDEVQASVSSFLDWAKAV